MLRDSLNLNENEGIKKKTASKSKFKKAVIKFPKINTDQSVWNKAEVQIFHRLVVKTPKERGGGNQREGGIDEFSEDRRKKNKI